MEKKIIKEIKEDANIHEEWYKEAKNVTVETLSEFIRHITEDYGHDYGTICHALAASAIAAAHAVDHSPTGGITGFQAGVVTWEFIRHWLCSDNKCGLKMVDYDNMLYPQYSHYFEKTISAKTFETLQTEAKRNLEESRNPSLEVVIHWQNIVNGIVPFGYSIEED